jgi:hypothetical protein
VVAQLLWTLSSIPHKVAPRLHDDLLGAARFCGVLRGLRGTPYLLCLRHRKSGDFPNRTVATDLDLDSYRLDLLNVQELCAFELLFYECNPHDHGSNKVEHCL